jgi:glutathione S-transferase
MAPQYKLSYFESRGLAEQCRFVFAFAGVEFEDVRHKDMESWGKLKANYTWGVLPMLEEDGKVLAQSSAILRYLGKKFNLAGDNDFEAAKCDEMVEALGDLKKAAFPALMEKDETKKAELIATLKNETFPKFLSVFNKLIEANGGFLVGKRFSYADFAVASTVDIFADHLGKNLFDNYPAFKAHFDSVFNAKGIKEWVAKRPKSQF